MPIDKIQLEKCCGCSACVNICPVHCISMEEDDEGFLYPNINHQMCVECELCLKTCPVYHSVERTNKILKAYVGYVNDDSVRLASSSGGLFSPIATSILNKNGVVFGAMIDNTQNVHHVCISRVSDLHLLRGSKYVQSNILNTFAEAKKYLDSGRLVLFSGTACQISGLKSFLRKPYDNLYLLDVLCHGTPSPKVLVKYLEEKQKKYASGVDSLSFRHKKTGWKRYSVEIQFANSKTYSKEFGKDMFMRSFLSNICLRPSCYDCGFKALERDSDITLGDAWGIERIMPDMDDDKGTSVIIVHSDKGRKLLDSVMDQITIREGEVDRLVPPQSDSRRSVKRHPNRVLFFKRLNEGSGLNDLLVLFNDRDPIVKRVKNRIQRETKRILRK